MFYIFVVLEYLFVNIVGDRVEGLLGNVSFRFAIRSLGIISFCSKKNRLSSRLTFSNISFILFALKKCFLM